MADFATSRPKHLDVPLVHREQGVEHPDRGCLPGPVGAEQPEDFAPGHIEVDAVDGHVVAKAVPEAPTGDSDDGPGVPCPIRPWGPAPSLLDHPGQPLENRQEFVQPHPVLSRQPGQGDAEGRGPPVAPGPEGAPHLRVEIQLGHPAIGAVGPPNQGARRDQPAHKGADRVRCHPEAHRRPGRPTVQVVFGPDG